MTSAPQQGAKPRLKVILAEPRGFCAGVERAVTAVETALERFGAPVYVRHEIVHNRYVLDNLRSKGAVFVGSTDDIPEGAVCVFSAHGVSEAVEEAAKARNLRVVDASCPLVTKVHLEAAKHAAQGRRVILIGHAGHPEVEGTAGRVPGGVLLVESVEDAEALTPEDPSRLAYVTQTTLSLEDTKAIVDVLIRRFPEIQGPGLNDICYATRNRQEAVRELAKTAQAALVIGAANSSNSNRLRDLAERCGAKGYLINGPEDIDFSALEGLSVIGLTAGASAPESLVEATLAALSERFDVERVAQPNGVKENVNFKAPKMPETV